MTTLLEPSYRKTNAMFASPLHGYCHRRNVRSGPAAYRFLRYLNMGTLALAMFVALALLSNTRGKDSEPGKSAPAKTATTQVVIDNFSFSPKTFTVPVGATVTWTNHDSVPHTVMSVNNQFKKSPAIKANQRFSNTFATAGTYSYFCSIHPRMTGEIIVK
jgi:plastocyanin